MQLRHIKNLLAGQGDPKKRSQAACWAPNNKRLAIADHSRLIRLYDETGEPTDRFPTKAQDGKSKSYVVRAIRFSPDSTKLAIAQSDNIIFIYKIGLEKGDRKSIVNKFATTCAVTGMEWPTNRPGEIIFSLAEGKVRIGQLKSNRAQTLYSTESYVVSLAMSTNGNQIISGHLDGSIYKFDLESGESAAKLISHPVVPAALSWGESIAVAGSDCKVVFYDTDGNQMQHFTYHLDEEKEFTCASFNPTGHSLVVGSWNKFRNYNYNSKQARWEEGEAKLGTNLFSINLLSWKADGSRLMVSTCTGGADIFDACIRRIRHKNKFEFTYISPSQVIVKRLPAGPRIVLKSQYQYEIQRVNVRQDHFLIANTDTTLLMGDLQSCKLSEISWTNNTATRERFFFDSPQVCMVYLAGELSLVEYGRNEILGTCRTEHVNRHLLSVRICGPPPEVGEDAQEEVDRRKKTIAYLIDRQTIRILDLVSGMQLCQVHHNTKIDWLELNKRATKLLFRDKSRCLFIYDVDTQERKTLLNYCSYVQWVPEADVVVAQNRGDLCVWYSIDNTDRVTLVPIKGEVTDIERTPGGDGVASRTEVVVDEGVSTVAYALDEALIEFGSAMEGNEYERACSLLDEITMTPETEALWQNLSDLTLKKGNYLIAERCAAALGDVAKARSLASINYMADHYKQEHKQNFGSSDYDGYSHYEVQAAIHIHNKNYKSAEAVLLDQNKVDEAMGMWEEFQKHGEAIRIAEAKNHPGLDAVKSKYLEWLLETDQEEEAAELKEKEKKYQDAIDLYLRGGLPARAAHVVNHYGVQCNSQTQEAIASALSKAGMYEKAGEFFERMGLTDRAIDSYKQGHSYRRAVELSRKTPEMAGHVTKLEEEWGDWLVSQKQVDAAINHYTEAGQYIKAINSAINSRQWTKAIQIVDNQDASNPETMKFYKMIGNHFEDARQYSEAEKYYIKAGLRQETVEMYTRVGNWDQAHKVAKMYMSTQEISALYINQAVQYEYQGKFKEAERLYLKTKEPDLAINMYKRGRRFDDMVRLVAVHRKELLLKTHQTLAVQLEKENNFKQAEYHYVQAKEWRAASNMYRDAEMWEDAVRCAKLHGGVPAGRQVVFVWASHLGGEQGAKLLMKYGLVEQAIEYAIGSSNFQHAIDLASASLKSKLPYVYLKHAMFLEDEGRFEQAESAFIKANKPKEAIDMYIHQHDWLNAMRVADQYDQTSITDILVAQARVAFERKDYERAEEYLLRASKPELLVKIYKEARMWSDAQRIAQEYCPSKLKDVKDEYAKWLEKQKMAGDNKGERQVADLLIEANNWTGAIDALLKITPSGGNDEEVVRGWKQAVDLATHQHKERQEEVLANVRGKLCGMNRHGEAAKLFEDVEKWQDAVNVYVEGRLWDKAIPIAERLGPECLRNVQEARKEALVEEGSPDDLFASGSKKEAFDLWARREEWSVLMPKVRQENNNSLLAKYSGLYVQFLSNNGKFVEAAKVVLTDGMGSRNPDPKLANIYLNFGLGFIRELPVNFELGQIRESVVQLVANLEPLKDALSPQLKVLDKIGKVLHHFNMAAEAANHDLTSIRTKNMLSLVRYTNTLPVLKVLFDSGNAARKAEDNNTAMLLLNPMLDIFEMEDEDPDALTDWDATFENTDMPDLNNLDLTEMQNEAGSYKPIREAIGADAEEECRSWVLQAATDGDDMGEQKLKTVPCPNCDKDLWEGAATCPHCQTHHEECVVTGFPILDKTQRAECSNCNRGAKREAWNQWIMKAKRCPSCGNFQHVS